MFFLSLLSSGEHIGCPFATQEESSFEDELPAFSFLSFDPIMVAEQFTLMDAVSALSSFSSQLAEGFFSLAAGGHSVV